MMAVINLEDDSAKTASTKSPTTDLRKEAADKDPLLYITKLIDNIKTLDRILQTGEKEPYANQNLNKENK